MNPAYLLAALGSVFFGAADFAGGIAAKRAHAASVTLVAGLPALLVLLVGFVWIQGTPTAAAIAWGAAGGLCGGIGMTLLYRVLAMGPVSVASPVLCVTGLAIPVIFGIALGERPGAWGIAGLLLAPLSIVMLTRTGAAMTDDERHRVRQVIAPSLLCGCVVGFFLLFLGRVPAGSGLVPLVVARLVGMATLAIWMAATRAPFLLERGVWKATIIAGLLDSAANVSYVIAVQQGSLALVAALVSLSPATSVLLARVMLGEHWSTPQRVGLVAALAAGALISLG